MPDVYTNTATTNFSKTVVELIKKQAQETLRGGLVYTPRGSVIPAMLMPGTNGIFRSFGYSDLPEDGAVSIEDGQADPDVEDLDIDYVEFQGTAKARTVGVTDNAKARSPHDLSRIAVDKVSRDIAVSVDNVPRALYKAAGADLFGGSGNLAESGLDAADVMTADLLKDAVAILRYRDVKPLASGLYAFVADPLVIRDLQSDADYIEEMKHADPKTFLTGQVGQYAGAAILDAGSRGIVSVDGATTLIAAGATTVAAADDTFTTTNPHGLAVNDTIRIVSITGGTGLAVGTVYHVITAATAITFKVSATAGGASVDVTADGSAVVFGRPTDAHYGTLIGADSVFAALGGLRVIPVVGPDKADPLDRRDLYSWKGFLGGILNDLQNDRFLNVAVQTSITG